MAKKPRTITISDEVYEGLRKIAQFNRYKGNSNLVTPSALLEYLAQNYIDANQTVIQMIAENEAKMAQAALKFSNADNAV